MFKNNDLIFFSLPLKSVIAPQYRATATAFQILLSHLFGDAGSPYVVGQVRRFFSNKTANYTPNYTPT